MLFKEYSLLDFYEVINLKKLQRSKIEPQKIDKNCLLSSYKGQSFFQLFIGDKDLLNKIYQLLEAENYPKQ